MRVACVGGGPGGLFLGILLRTHGLADEVTIYERNGPDDTFGFGVVFSDETLDNLRLADEESLDAIAAEFRHWSDIEVHRNGRVARSTGHGFAAIGRLRLLQLLTARAVDLGVDVKFHAEIDDPVSLDPVDLVVACDGVNSGLRRRAADRFQPTIELGASRYAWFGTPKPFDNFTFVFEDTPHGMFQAHCYPYSRDMSTLIVETSEETWRLAGLDATEGIVTGAGETDQLAMEFTEDLFAIVLDGAGLVGNNSKWLQFPTISNRRWHDGKVVLLGDAAHTAHFSVGSGTKLAMEDAIALAGALVVDRDLDDSLNAYEEERRPGAESIQRAAATSRTWFEDVRRYSGMDDEQFVFQVLTRSQRITLDNLGLRDPALASRTLAWFRERTDPALRPHRPPGTADVLSAAASGSDAPQPGRGVPDGPVLRHGWRT